MGVCRIYIGGKPTESAVWTGAFLRSMLTPLESNFGRGDAGVATVDPDYLQYQGSHCRSAEE